ncbi:MAG TPA: SPOR domain-containing protein [Thermoanaerobaculia bacterium]|nr:SPOR domain-containing protein [Thermoanaerobaculia bacterium]
MEEQHHTDDQSHYEISLTAGQAFIAFVLLLLSLAASFGFGLMIGKGQADERLVVRKETPVVTEGAMIPSRKESEGKIVELPAEADDEPAPATETTAPTETVSTIIEEAPPAATETTVTTAATEPAAPVPSTPLAMPMFAQLLSTSDQRTAEVLAARVIEKGFSSAYVERGSTDKGPVYRVRVKFPSEADARAAEPKLKEFSKEVWITSK